MSVWVQTIISKLFIERLKNKQMIRVEYEKMIFHHIDVHYDVHWSGTCIYDGKIARFITHDDTDYQTMDQTCPHCYYDADPKYCHCEAYVDLWCEVIPLPSLLERSILHLKKLYYKLRYNSRYSY